MYMLMKTFRTSVLNLMIVRKCTIEIPLKIVWVYYKMCYMYMYIQHTENMQVWSCLTCTYLGIKPNFG